jgi:hypothetical protein
MKTDTDRRTEQMILFSSEVHLTRRKASYPSPVIVLIALSITLLDTDSNIKVRFPIGVVTTSLPRYDVRTGSSKLIYRTDTRCFHSDVRQAKLEIKHSLSSSANVKM